MCGIFCAVSLGNPFSPDDYGLFTRQTDLVFYRGPDASGYLALNSRTQSIAINTEFDIFLGHRRLSIIDLSEGGRQPMTDGKGRWISYNGEIFNYLELREELKKKGHEFRTGTDTEVILKIYDIYGEAGFEQLNGMWAFVIVDLPAGRVVLSRDRFSIKPLYYTRQGDKLFVCSEIKQLVPFLSRKSLNIRVMYKYLVQGVADDSTDTFFEDVHSAKSKHNLVLELSSHTLREKQYWEYHQLAQLSEPDAIRYFRDLFVDAIRIRLRSDVPIGALLSGGLDSSGMVVVAKDVLGLDIRTFSVVAEQTEYSEERFIEILTRRGVSNERLSFNSNEALQALDKVIYHNDEPFLGLHAVAQFQVLEKIKRETNITVVLSGQGGDECLLGYSKFFFFYLQELLKQGRLLAAANLFLSSLFKGTTVRQFRFGDAKRYLPGRQMLRGATFIRLKEKDELIGMGNDGLRQRQILDIDRYSVPVQTHFEDRNSMAHSLEMRTPFFDHRLVELSLSLPISLKLRDGWSKFVLRETLPELPPEIRWRRDKQGFLTPEERWIRLELRPMIEQAFSSSLLQQLGVIDDRKFQEYYSRFLGGDPTIGYGEISRAFLAERWAHIFLS